jgi:hypothetical protein
MCSKGSAAFAKKSNPMHKWVVESAKMNFDVPDSAPAATLNEVIWHSVKGPHVPMPESRHNVIPETAKDADDAVESKKAKRDADDEVRTGRGGSK